MRCQTESERTLRRSEPSIQFALQPLVFGDEPFVASAFGINRGMQRPPRLFLPIRQQHQRPLPRPAQMRAVADMRTFVFMFGVKTESNRHPSRMPKLQALAIFWPRSDPEGLNCYYNIPFLRFQSNEFGLLGQRVDSPLNSGCDKASLSSGKRTIVKSAI